eukprot:5004727-Karenia_brevis.AAC.1
MVCPMLRKCAALKIPTIGTKLSMKKDQKDYSTSATPASTLSKGDSKKLKIPTIGVKLGLC